MRRRDEIEKKYLVTIAHYGKVILRSNRAEFDKEVEGLKAEVSAFQHDAKTKLDAAIQKNCAEVIVRLLPIVKGNPPVRWRARLGLFPDERLLTRTLEQELRSAYGEATEYLEKIEVRLIYKDITAEMLRDADFGKAAEKAKLYLREMYQEYQAARARD